MSDPLSSHSPMMISISHGMNHFRLLICPGSSKDSELETFSRLYASMGSENTETKRPVLITTSRCSVCQGSQVLTVDNQFLTSAFLSRSRTLGPSASLSHSHLQEKPPNTPLATSPKNSLRLAILDLEVAIQSLLECRTVQVSERSLFRRFQKLLAAPLISVQDELLDLMAESSSSDPTSHESS